MSQDFEGLRGLARLLIDRGESGGQPRLVRLQLERLREGLLGFNPILSKAVDIAEIVVDLRIVGVPSEEVSVGGRGFIVTAGLDLLTGSLHPVVEVSRGPPGLLKAG